MSASLANDSRARPKVLGSSTSDMSASSVVAILQRRATSPIAEPRSVDCVQSRRRRRSRSSRRRRRRRHRARRASSSSVPRHTCCAGRRRVDDDRRRRAARPAAVDQPTGNRRRSRQPHQHDDVTPFGAQRARSPTRTPPRRGRRRRGTPTATPRCVTGMPASAGAAIALRDAGNDLVRRRRRAAAPALLRRRGRTRTDRRP